MNTPDDKLALNRGTNVEDRMGFDKSVLGMTPEEVARRWIDRNISGRSGAPKRWTRRTSCRRSSEKMPGSIGYVRQHELSDAMKLIKIDRKLPGDVGYPISAVGRSNARNDSPASSPSRPHRSEHNALVIQN